MKRNDQIAFRNTIGSPVKTNLIKIVSLNISVNKNCRFLVCIGAYMRISKSFSKDNVLSLYAMSMQSCANSLFYYSLYECKTAALIGTSSTVI